MLRVVWLWVQWVEYYRYAGASHVVWYDTSPDQVNPVVSTPHDSLKLPSTVASLPRLSLDSPSTLARNCQP